MSDIAYPEGSIAEVSNTDLVSDLPIALLIMANCYCVRHYTRHLMYSISFNSYNSRWALLSLFIDK